MPWPFQFSSGSSQSSSGSSQPSLASSQSSTSSRRTTSSYYSFNGERCDGNDPNSKMYIKASDARAQQANMPAKLARRGYPSAYGNSEGLPLSTPGSTVRPGRGNEWVHAPVIPDVRQAYRQGPPGGVRSAWTAGDPKNFDVMYHDKSTGTSASGAGRFRLANYHPAASTNSSNDQAASANYSNNPAAPTNSSNGRAASTNYNGRAASTNYSNNPAYDRSSSSRSHSQGYSGQSQSQ